MLGKSPHTHLGVRLARHKPEQFLNDAARKDSLGGKQRQGVATQRETQTRLRAKYGECASTSPVTASVARLDDFSDEREVLVLFVTKFHGRILGVDHWLRTGFGGKDTEFCEPAGEPSVR